MYTIKVKKRFRLFAKKKVIASHDIADGWLKLVSDKGVELIRDVSIRSIVLYPDYYAHLRVKRDQEMRQVQEKEAQYRASNPAPMQAPTIHQAPIQRAEESQNIGWETQYNQEALRRATERVNGLQV